MDKTELDQMRADMAVGTESHWWKSQLDFYLDEDNGYSVQKSADYSRVARVPAMEQTIIAQADEIARLRDELHHLGAVLGDRT